jgi:hypothetical protein
MAPPIAVVEARLATTRSELLRGRALSTVHTAADVREEAAAVRAACEQGRRSAARWALRRPWRIGR